MKFSGKGFRGVAAFAGLLIVVLAGLLIAHGEHHTADTSARPIPAITAGTMSLSPVTAQHIATVPDRAVQTLREIDAGRWPDSANAPGTKGGDHWMNRQGQLPQQDSAGHPITYQEWDVNPKKPGQGRDAERIITGSDGSAYYTGDHYKTFTRMR
ncbi:ribonuclease domain-containing protein [Nocardia sp. alder85J]|uniref:ribonuclease domain-containing protein n=1 Tax=Nocardia sp. alder85J TaxID=2862949 RepID=UPI001CD47E80|nr:ribonuclease domain-containing protein [Nocardia sp. alder85J]MCX4097226.1 ribonuclease [Nocardia sp. alder85J]